MTEGLVISDLTVIWPEILIASLALILQILGVFGLIKNNNLARIAVISLTIIMALVISLNSEGSFLGGMIELNISTKSFKLLQIASAIIVLLIFIGYNEISGKYKSDEFIALVIIALVGANFAVMTSNLLLLFVSLEVVALPSYVIATYNSKDGLSTEAGIKYFILGALSTCIMLFGISYIYGFTGSLDYNQINNSLANSNNNLGLITGVIFLLVGIFFKLSLAPFHFWTPDVYHGAPAIAMTLFASLAKFAALAVLYNIFKNMIGSTAQFSWVIALVAGLSVVVGSLGGIVQQSIKRILGYSTILNMGFVIVPLLSNNSENWSLGITYLLIYAAANLGLIATMILALGEKFETANLQDISGLAADRKGLSLIITIFLCSMIGIPPLAGFFAKYYVITSALEGEEFVLIALMLISSVIAAYYYLNIIRHIYFSEKKASFRHYQSPELTTVIGFALVFVLMFAVYL